MATHLSPISAKKSSSIPTTPKYTAPPVLQPKTTKKSSQELPEWKPGGGGAANPLQRLLDSKASPVELTIGQYNGVAPETIQRTKKKFGSFVDKYLLDNAISTEAMERFAQKEYSQENLLCARDIKLWKEKELEGGKIGPQVTIFKKIYNTYVKAQSPYECNFQGTTVQVVKDIINYKNYGDMYKAIALMENDIQTNLADTISRAKFDSNTTGRQRSKGFKK